MSTGKGERCFTGADTMLAPPGVAASYGHRRVLYERAEAAAAVKLALALARRPRIRAVTVVPGGADGTRIGLALAFSAHLAAVRAGRGLRQVCVTSPHRPLLPSPVLRRVPHLVTVTAPEGGWRDAVVWEVTTVDRLRAWLGPTAGAIDLRRLEEWVPRLLELRRAVRESALPATPAGRALAELLAGRYLSILLVAQHAPLFADLLDDPTLEENPSS